MMIMDNPLIWVLIGILTAFLFFKSLEWSVNKIHPNHAQKSMGLILVGTILRWILISGVLIFSLSHSATAALIVIFIFIVLRFIFLLKWQGWLRASH